MSETFNSYILNSRDKALIHMLEDIRKNLMTRMCDIASSIEKCEDILCPNIRKKLEKIQNQAMYCQLRQAVGEKFEVDYFEESYIVDLIARECNCRGWELTGLPCCHIMACIIHKRDEIVSYVDPFYFKINCVETYKHGLTPIHTAMDEWPLVTGAHILPPHYVKLPGRPSKNRKRERDEVRKQSRNKLSRQSLVRMTCSNCGALGHNKRSCKEVNPRMNQSTPNNEANSTILTERREMALTRQGYGVRIFPSGNIFARTPGGTRVQYISGARAAATVSQQVARASASTQSNHGGSQVIDTATPPPTI
ncbi:hypothetical protein C2S51_038276 [Perilla frutescens var. frutescens]|nr:hypothetical protein C2S51_038276 [Perilla frutescens var. frutescens]